MPPSRPHIRSAQNSVVFGRHARPINEPRDAGADIDTIEAGKGVDFIGTGQPYQACHLWDGHPMRDTKLIDSKVVSFAPVTPRAPDRQPESVWLRAPRLDVLAIWVEGDLALSIMEEPHILFPVTYS